jgi:hypothetical protein
MKWIRTKNKGVRKTRKNYSPLNLTDLFHQHVIHGSLYAVEFECKLQDVRRIKINVDTKQDFPHLLITSNVIRIYDFDTVHYYADYRSPPAQIFNTRGLDFTASMTLEHET